MALPDGERSLSRQPSSSAAGSKNMAHTVDRLFEECSLTREELAERAGLPLSRIEAILAGRWLPSPLERNKLAVALHVDVADVDWGHTMNPRNVRYHRFGLTDPP